MNIIKGGVRANPLPTQTRHCYKDLTASRFPVRLLRNCRQKLRFDSPLRSRIVVQFCKDSAMSLI